MRRILLGVVALLALTGRARADDKKDATQAVRDQIANLFDNADHAGGYGDGVFTPGSPTWARSTATACAPRSRSTSSSTRTSRRPR